MKLYEYIVKKADGEYIVNKTDGEYSAGIVEADTPEDAKEKISKVQQCPAEQVEVIPVQFDENGIFNVVTNKKTLITVEDIATISVKVFTEDCLNTAKENWSKNEVKMLERLFESIKEGCEYKCIGCSYFGKECGAPDSVPKVCMWDFLEDED